VSDFSISGDLGAVDQLARQIGMLGRRDFQRGMLREMGQAGIDLVHQEFATSHDPEGDSWAKLKKPRGFGGGPLDATGALKGSIRMRLTAEGFALYTLKKYAPFHQDGTRNMVARSFFPVGTPPASWLMRFDRIADAHVRRLLPMAA